MIAQWSFGEEPVPTLGPGFQWTMRVKRIVDETALSVFVPASFLMKSSEARRYNSAHAGIT